jgi:membrane protease YdiL (CAAX protease family)
MAEMARGSENSGEVRTAAATFAKGTPSHTDSSRSPLRAVLETAWVFGLLEVVLWTPRSLWHSLVIALLALSPIWLTWKSSYTKRELGFSWPESRVSLGIVSTGFLLALALVLGTKLLGYPVPANPNWPKLGNIVPYFLWAFFQQFLLESVIFVRMETAFGSRAAVVVSSLLFTLAHLPNLPLTALTLFGAVIFTELFRRYRSIWPLGLAHFAVGMAIAYTFPDSVMHHMRVGLSFHRF